MGVWYFLRICLYLNAYFVLVPSNRCRKIRSCICNEAPKQLTCFNLHYIPKPPDFIETMILHNNYFTHVDKATFSNISSIKIKKLVLRNNSIRMIGTAVFSDLLYLEQLEIEDEEKLSSTELKSAFKDLNIQTIKRLYLEGNTWFNLQSDTFEHLDGANLELISLTNNKLREFGTDILQPIKRLHKLDCSNNDIVSVTVTNTPPLDHWDLSSNNIVFLPNFCQTHNNISQKFITLVLTDNAIRDMSAISFNCLENLQILNLDGNRMKSLENNVFANLPSLRKLSLSRIMQLETIKSWAFNFPSLETLLFADNRFRFDRSGKYQPQTIFKSSKTIKELDLTHNFLPCKNVKKLLMILSPLTQLRSLVLHSASLCSIPDGLLRRLPNLVYLNLMGNKIDTWNGSLFQNATSLRKLNMEGNLIHIINERSFPMDILNALEELHLGDNPFWCTCEQKWFLDAIRSTNLTNKLVLWPSRFTCYYPDYLRFSLMANYHPTYTECNMLSIIIITISTGFGLILVVMTLILRCQINIRNALYYLRVYRLRKSGYLKLGPSDEFEYDAFIVYCDADREWVHTSLLQQLESSGLKMCVHHRDFDVGEHIIDNIEKYMDKCWKIIVVMSNKMAESEWCQWEVELILERRRRLGKNALVLIMYRQIDSRHMTSPLRSLISTTPFLTFIEGFGEKLFWKAVKNCVKKPLSYPPTALL